MSKLDRSDLQLAPGDTLASVEILRILDDRQDTPCQFCTDEQVTEERWPIAADYAVDEQDGDRTRMCDYCVDPSLVVR